MTEGRVGELEDKQDLHSLNRGETKTKQQQQKSEQSLRDLWYNNKCFNFIEVPEGEREGMAKQYSEKQWVKCLKFDERHKPTHLRR